LPDILARDIMTRKVVTLQAEQPVIEAAKTLSQDRISGAPVLDEDGKVIGMVEEGDLIIQDVRLHFPTYVHFLDSYIYLGSLSKFESTLKKAVGARVKDIMTTEVPYTTPDASIQDVATLMMQKDIHLVPVVQDDKLVGVISRGDIVKSLGRD